jgi:hypothetical protein
VRSVVVAAVFFGLVGCGGSTPAGRRLYALSTGTPGQTGFGARELSVVDASSWRVLRSTPVGGQGRALLSLDPFGRPWVSRHGVPGKPEAVVEVFSPEGDELATVATCSGGQRVVFLDGLAWIACEATGFVGTLVRIRLSDLAPGAEPTPLSFPGSDAFTVTAAGSVVGAVVVAGSINGGQAGLLSFGPTKIDSFTFGVGTSIGEIVPDGYDALLLNSISGLVRPVGSAADAFLYRNLASFPGIQIVPSPRAAVVVKGSIYASARGSGRPVLARRAATSDDVTTWPTTLAGDVDAMATDSAGVFLAHHETEADDADGVYELAPDTGALTLRLPLPDVSDLAFASHP